MDGDSSSDTWTVIVERASESRGGFLIRFATDDGRDGYTDAVETLAELDEYFQQDGWVVEW